MEPVGRALVNSPGILLQIVAGATILRVGAPAPNDILFVGCRALSVIYEKVAWGLTRRGRAWASEETGPGWKGGAW